MIYHIYKLTCQITEKSYIGFTNNVLRRMRQHKKAAAVEIPKNYIHKAIKKYGWENFEMNVLFSSKDKDYMLHEMEPYFIVYYNSISNGYNLTRGGQSREGYKNKEPRTPLTLEQKEYIGICTKQAMADPEIRQKLRDGQKKIIRPKGYKHTEQSKKNMSQGHLSSMNDDIRNRISEASKIMWLDPEIREKHIISRKNISDETREKMSKAKIGKSSWNSGTKLPDINKICLECSKPYTVRPCKEKTSQFCSKGCGATHRHRINRKSNHYHEPIFTR